MEDRWSALVTEAIEQQFGVSDLAVVWERPAESENGDRATPVAFQVASRAKKNPAEVANVVASTLEGDADIEKVEIAGPGYVNVWLTVDALLRSLNATRTACTAKVKEPGQRPVIVEYSQPNIAKPLGAHHLVTTLVGQALVNLYRHMGQEVIAWNYMGDWGTQFGKLSVSYDRYGEGKPIEELSVDELLDLYVRFHDEAKNDPSMEDEARAAFTKLEQDDKEMRAFWEVVVKTTKGELGHIYDRLHVSFDTDKSESFYEDKMDPIVEEGKQKNVFQDGDKGALMTFFEEDSNLPPYMILKGDGSTLYSTRDLANMRYRHDTHDPQEILIVTDVAQKLHFEQLAETCRLLGWDIEGFENTIVGRMRFADKSMSTRKGNILKLKEVLEEAVKRADEVIASHGDEIQTDDQKDLSEMMGVGAVAYGILSQNRQSNIVFDWAKFLGFDGNSAPYLQYTHARARSVLRKADVDDVSLVSTADLSDKERDLINALSRFDEVLQEVRREHLPHLLANYLFGLCQDFNGFYNSEPILKAEGDTKMLRLSLTELTADVLKTGAEILTIRVPDRM